MSGKGAHADIERSCTHIELVGSHLGGSLDPAWLLNVQSVATNAFYQTLSGQQP